MAEFHPMVFSALDHPDFRLNEQQEAVLDVLRSSLTEWMTTYDFHGAYGMVNGKEVKIGDAGRRMRELREAGILESRKRGRFEEYRVVPKKQPGKLF